MALKYGSKWKSNYVDEVFTIGQVHTFENGVKYFIVDSKGGSVLASEEFVRQNYKEIK